MCSSFSRSRGTRHTPHDTRRMSHDTRRMPQPHAASHTLHPINEGGVREHAFKDACRPHPTPQKPYPTPPYPTLPYPTPPHPTPPQPHLSSAHSYPPTLTAPLHHVPHRPLLAASTSRRRMRSHLGQLCAPSPSRIATRGSGRSLSS